MTWTYSITSDTDSACNIDGNGGLTFNRIGTCTVKAVPSATGYNTHAGISRNVVISLGNQPAPGAWGANPWGGATSIKVGQRIALGTTAPNNVKSDGGSLEYITSGGGCFAGISDGSVRGSAVSASCTVKGRFGSVANKWNPSGYSNVGSVAVVRGDQVNITGWTNPYGASPSLSSDGTSTLTIRNNPTPSSRGSAGIAYRLKSTTTSGACTLDATDGTVTAGSTTGTCAIEAQYKQSTNYLPSTNWYTILNIQVTSNIQSDTLNVAWTNYSPSTVTYSESVTAPTFAAPTVTNGSSTTITTGFGLAYSIGANTTNSSCSVGNTSGALTINGAGVCHVIVTATDNDNGDLFTYTSGTAENTVTINKGVQKSLVTWNAYASTTASTGGTALSVTTQPGVTGYGSPGVEYQRRDSSTAACTVASDGTVTPGATAGACVVEARFVEIANYEASAWKYVATISVGQVQNRLPSSATGAYGNDPYVRLGGHVLSPSWTVADGQEGAQVEYRAASGSEVYCRVTSYGAIFPLSVGDCVVEARYAASISYVAGAWEVIETIPVEANAGFTFNTLPTISYTGGIASNGAKANFDLSVLPATDNSDTPKSLRWSWNSPATTGYGINGSRKDNVCSMDSSGVLTGGTSAAVGDTCRVAAFAASTGSFVGYYYIYLDVIVKEAQDAPDTNVGEDGFAYNSGTAAAALANGGSATIDAAPSGGGAHGSLQYRSKNTNCTVNDTTGAVSVSGSTGAKCVVFTRWSGDATYAPSPWKKIWDFQIQ